MKLQLYNIRCAKVSEYDRIKAFINQYWKKGHILAVSQILFDFQHLRKGSETYDFVIAEHKETEEIHAVYGFINSSIYDGSDEDNPNAVWGALWKVRKEIDNKEIRKIGLAVMFYILDLYPNSPFITLGLSKFSQAIFEGVNFGFGKMNHYYFANKNCIHPVIAESPQFVDISINDSVSIHQYSYQENVKSDYIPVKNCEYLLNRYTNHPYYKYDLYGLYKDNTLICVLVLRLVEKDGARCLRLVDIVGRTRNWPNSTFVLNQLVEDYNAEYIDCYNYGISEKEFANLGMIQVKEPTIIPDYFEPFEKRNIDIYYAFYYDKDVCVFKADGDQDRPSIL